jgi:hypothetical protein
MGVKWKPPTYIQVEFRVSLVNYELPARHYYFRPGHPLQSMYVLQSFKGFCWLQLEKSSWRRIHEKPPSLAPPPPPGWEEVGGGGRGERRAADRGAGLSVGPPPIARSKLQKKMDGWSQLVAGSSVLGLTCWVNWWWWWAGLGLRQ